MTLITIAGSTTVCPGLSHTEALLALCPFATRWSDAYADGSPITERCPVSPPIRHRAIVVE